MTPVSVTVPHAAVSIVILICFGFLTALILLNYISYFQNEKQRRHALEKEKQILNKEDKMQSSNAKLHCPNSPETFPSEGRHSDPAVEHAEQNITEHLPSYGSTEQKKQSLDKSTGQHNKALSTKDSESPLHSVSLSGEDNKEEDLRDVHVHDEVKYTEIVKSQNDRSTPIPWVNSHEDHSDDVPKRKVSKDCSDGKLSKITESSQPETAVDMEDLSR